MTRIKDLFEVPKNKNTTLPLSVFSFDTHGTSKHVLSTTLNATKTTTNKRAETAVRRNISILNKGGSSHKQATMLELLIKKDASTRNSTLVKTPKGDGTNGPNGKGRNYKKLLDQTSLRRTPVHKTESVI
jgi:hypothetical protein